MDPNMRMRQLVSLGLEELQTKAKASSIATAYKGQDKSVNRLASELLGKELGWTDTRADDDSLLVENGMVLSVVDGVQTFLPPGKKAAAPARRPARTSGGDA